MLKGKFADIDKSSIIKRFYEKKDNDKAICIICLKIFVNKQITLVITEKNIK